MQVFVGGLDPSATDDLLKQTFSPYGELLYVKIPVGKRCGFVQYSNRYEEYTLVLLFDSLIISVLVHCADQFIVSSYMLKSFLCQYFSAKISTQLVIVIPHSTLGVYCVNLNHMKKDLKFIVENASKNFLNQILLHGFYLD